MRYALLLRGINLGPHKKVPMADLRALLSAAGYGGVRTLLNSGNAVVSSQAEASQIEDDVSARLAERFGFSVPVMVRTGTELRAVVDGVPFAEAADQPKGFHVLFCSRVPGEAAMAEAPGHVQPDRVALSRSGREIYVHVVDGVIGSPAFDYLSEVRLGVRTTARTLTTTMKLAALTSP